MRKGEAAPQKAGYHHGDLRNALLVAAEAELTEKGVEGFSLRGVAKRAGVSHAAPAHHFHDTGAMLTALAAIGSDRLAQAMSRRRALSDGSPRERFIALGIGYVEFAVANPALFKLMFASDRPDMADENLQEKASGSFMMLVEDMSDLLGRGLMADEDGMMRLASAWSIVHGLANLIIGRRIGFIQPMLDRDFVATVRDVVSAVAPAET